MLQNMNQKHVVQQQQQKQNDLPVFLAFLCFRPQADS